MCVSGVCLDDNSSILLLSVIMLSYMLSTYYVQQSNIAEVHDHGCVGRKKIDKIRRIPILWNDVTTDITRPSTQLVGGLSRCWWPLSSLACSHVHTVHHHQYTNTVLVYFTNL